MPNTFTQDTSPMYIEAGGNVFRPRFRTHRAMLHALVTPSGRRSTRFALTSHYLYVQERQDKFSENYQKRLRRWVRCLGGSVKNRTAQQADIIPD